MANYKDLMAALKAVLKSNHDKEDKAFVDQSNKKAELPGEFRLNMHSAFGCALFLVVILIVNILILILAKIL